MAASTARRLLKLTEREAEVIRLRDEEGLAWREIAEKLGTTKGGANSSYRTAKAKRNRKPRAFAQTVEVMKPKETAEVLDAATDPFATIKAAAKQCGFPESTLKQLMKRMEVRYAPLDAAIREVKDKQMVKLLEDRAHRCLTDMDDFAMAGAGVRDLAVSSGIMIDKAQLLRGEPTQITKITDMREIDEKLKAVHAEMERRGMLIDVTLEKPAEGEPRP